jgi:hypothetical protein
LTLGLLVALIVSRWLAFPATIWDIDEAIFTRTLLDFDPAANFPHPPFFPLWILLGKLALWLHPHAAPFRALQLVSSAFSVWMFFPLLAVWSLILPRHHAAAATLLFLHLPLPWLLASRGYTGTAACGLLVACAAHWIRPPGVAPRFWAGASMAACCLLVRPQMAPLVVILALWRSRVHDRETVPAGS